MNLNTDSIRLYIPSPPSDPALLLDYLIGMFRDPWSFPLYISIRTDEGEISLDLTRFHRTRRSHFRSRFTLSHLNEASAVKNAGSYYRSTESGENSDILSDLCDSIGNIEKTYSNDILNKKINIKSAPLAGSFNHPTEITTQYINETLNITGLISSKRNDEEEIEIQDKVKEFLAIPNHRALNDSDLYDELLEYKWELCKATVKEFERIVEKPQMDVCCENEYPCVMVQVKEFNQFKEQRQSSLYKILMAYFIGFANDFALKEKIPFEIVFRASFGHSIPSVTQTSTSFRINIGIVPRAYATKVLAAGLKKLNAFVNEFILKQKFTSFDTKLKPLKFTWLEAELKSINKVIEKHNENKEPDEKLSVWTGKETVIEVLSIQLHSLRKPNKASIPDLCTIITNQNKYIELLTDYVHDTVIIKDGDDLTEPLKRMLLKLTCNENRDIHLEVKDSDFKNSDEFPEMLDGDSDVSNDEKFWDLICEIHYREKQSFVFSEFVNQKMSDKLQEYFETTCRHMVSNRLLPDRNTDSESDSECEFSIPDQKTPDEELCKYYSYKIILCTGMKAINVAAQYSINACNPRRTDTSYMYYEATDAIKIIWKHHEPGDERLQNVLRFIDLNHCSASGRNSVVDLKKIRNQMKKNLSKTKDEKEKFIVFDCTSATTKRVREAIQLFAPHVEVLLFVSSGLKNEQIGADSNPYGTLRVISANYKILFKSFISIKETVENEKIAAISNSDRRFYKNREATLTSKGIYGIDGWKYERKSHTLQKLIWILKNKLRKPGQKFNETNIMEQFDDLCKMVNGRDLSDLEDSQITNVMNKIELLHQKL